MAFFAKLDPETDIEQVAVGLLAVREHSRVELERKLTQRDFSAETIKQTLNQLEARGYLDDQRFTEQYLNMRLRKGYGPYRIRQELQAKGISNEVINNWIDDRDSLWRTQLADVAKRKFGPLDERSTKELGRRARFLEYRGFPPALIRDFLFSD